MENSHVVSSSGQSGLRRYPAQNSPSDHSNKENQHISLKDDDIFTSSNTSDRRLKRKRQNLFSNCTPLTVQRGQSLNPTGNSGSDNRKLTDKPVVILVNDSLESREDSSCFVVKELVCVQDSQIDSLSGCKENKEFNLTHSSFNISNSSCCNHSLDGNVGLHNSLLSPKDNIIADGLVKETNASLETKPFRRCQSSSHVTSTPVLDVNTLPAITGRMCKSDSEHSVLMDGKVVLEPLRITPIQWKKCLSASIEKQGSINSKVDQNSEEMKSSSISTVHKSNPSVELKECVVALEMLRITPLKQRSRYHLGAITAPDACVAINRGKSQLSFVEALTPVKNNQSTWSTSDKEELEPSAFDKIMLECDQEEPLKFTDFLDPSLLKSCVKIGEGVYGEVFRAQYKNGESVALKIIPVEGDFEVNGEAQKSFEEILPEIVISKELSLLGDWNKDDQTTDNISTSFITVHSVTCCRDKYPKHLISEWDKWDKEHNSENDRPDKFPSDQFFIVFEFSNGGKDLESFEFGTLSEAWSVLHQTALGLAVAENALEFEHRDLHWGNVLISRTDDEFIEGIMLGETKIVPTCGVRVSLIDFTLSRLTKDGVTVFCNIAEDESLFTGKGDYQFDVYRLMKKANKNDWEPFEPHTNSLWLQYLADKMLKKKKYLTKDKEIEARLKRFLRQAKKCSSATEIVQEFFD